MYTKNAHEQYKNIQVTTVDRGRLLLMMYEGAIKFLKQSKSGIVIGLSKISLKASKSF